jgi:hypothetical protein
MTIADIAGKIPYLWYCTARAAILLLQIKKIILYEKDI